MNRKLTGRKKESCQLEKAVKLETVKTAQLIIKGKRKGTNGLWYERYMRLAIATFLLQVE